MMYVKLEDRNGGRTEEHGNGAKERRSDISARAPLGFACGND